MPPGNVPFGLLVHRQQNTALGSTSGLTIFRLAAIARLQPLELAE
jgi:hypothetical protein